MRTGSRMWNLRVLVVAFAMWSLRSMAMKPPEQVPPNPGSQYSGVTMQQGRVATDDDFNEAPTGRSATMPRKDIRVRVPNVDTQRQVAPRGAPSQSTTTPVSKQPTPAQLPMRPVAPRLAPGVSPVAKKLPPTLLTPSLVVIGQGAGLASLPAVVSTLPLVVSGEGGSVAALAATVRTGPLAATGVAGTPMVLPSPIQTPALIVTGDQP